MPLIRSIFRLLIFFFTTGFAAILVIVLKLLGWKHEALFRIYRTWRRLILSSFNVQIEWIGSLPEGPSLLVGNHRSYLDVLMLPVNHPFVYVGKASVKKWPIIGWGGTALDTVWVVRENADSRHSVRQQLKERLADGKGVCLFPEGTTTRGPELLDFKPGMFKTAADNGFPITAIAIEYEKSDLAWVGNELFFMHMLRLIGRKKYRVKVGIREIQTFDQGTKALESTRVWIQDQVNAYRDAWDTL